MFVENNEDTVDSSEETVNDLEVSDADDASTTESEGAETSEGTKRNPTETAEQRQARIKRQVERDAKKAGVSIEEYLGISSQKGSQEGSKEVGDDRYARLELKTEGVTLKKAQDVVLDYIREAKLIGKDVDVATALKSPIVREAIAEIERKNSAPPPSKRTSTGASDSFEYWVSQARKGNFPRHDKEMMARLKKARIFTSYLL